MSLYDTLKRSLLNSLQAILNFFQIFISKNGSFVLTVLLATTHHKYIMQKQDN